ncbi:MAG: hypothetical protein LBT96_03455 [Campylobacteraceae bacterium]|nr:hypothetical protein [Campylobacteraceae bacterium]
MINIVKLLLILSGKKSADIKDLINIANDLKEKAEEEPEIERATKLFKQNVMNATNIILVIFFSIIFLALNFFVFLVSDMVSK